MTPHDISFFFIAAKPAGGRHMGLRQARSERLLAEGLSRESLLLLRSWPMPTWTSPSQGFSLKDHAAFNQQLAQLLTRGVPLVEALDVTEQTVSLKAKGVVSQIREMVSSGASLSEACERTGVFDVVTVAVYRAAERTGDLGGASSQLYTTARRQLAVLGKAATLMIYPAIVFVISILVSLSLIVFLVPRIGETMEEAGAKMPWFTVMMISIGRWLQTNGLWVLLGVAMVAMLVVIFRTRVYAAIMLFVRRLPLMSDLLLAQESTRFFSVMAAMTRSGVPIADALGVANEAIGFPPLRKQLMSMRQSLIDGGLLRQLIETVTVLPLGTRRLLIAAERSGDMESAFDSLAEDMSEEVDRRASRLLAVLEPLLIVMLVVMVGSVIMAIMIPMLTMASAVE